MTFGLGLFLGSLVSGWLAGTLGLSAVFVGSSAVALIALAVLGPGAGAKLSRGRRSPERDRTA